MKAEAYRSLAELNAFICLYIYIHKSTHVTQDVYLEVKLVNRISCNKMSTAVALAHVEANPGSAIGQRKRISVSPSRPYPLVLSGQQFC